MKRKLTTQKFIKRLQKIADVCASKLEHELIHAKETVDARLHSNYGRNNLPEKRLQFIIKELRGLQADCALKIDS